MDALGETLGLGRKVNTGGFALWESCMKGDPKAWAKMKRYNRQDVTLLEKVYDKLLPWMPSHPNIALMSGQESGCRNCGSTDLMQNGHRWTQTGKSPRFQCRKCHSYSSGRHRKLTEMR